MGNDDDVEFKAVDHCVAENVSGAPSNGGSVKDLNVFGKIEISIEVPPIVSYKTEFPKNNGASESSNVDTLNASVTFKLANLAILNSTNI